MLKVYCSPLRGLSGSAAVYSLLGHAFQAEYGCVAPEIKKTPLGKPFFPDKPDVHFSLSHAKTHVLCAISDKPVGADIESPRHISERAIQYFSTPEERSLFDPLDLWVLKESYIKLIGSNLALVKKIHFSFENGQIITPGKLAISRLYHIESCSAAISAYDDHLPDSIELI